jgi:hypothetical protein
LAADYPDARVASRDGARHGGGVIGRAVVDNEHLELTGHL